MLFIVGFSYWNVPFLCSLLLSVLEWFKRHFLKKMYCYYICMQVSVKLVKVVGTMYEGRERKINVLGHLSIQVIKKNYIAMQVSWLARGIGRRFFPPLSTVSSLLGVCICSEKQNPRDRMDSGLYQ